MYAGCTYTPRIGLAVLLLAGLRLARHQLLRVTLQQASAAIQQLISHAQ